METLHSTVSVHRTLWERGFRVWGPQGPIRFGGPSWFLWLAVWSFKLLADGFRDAKVNVSKQEQAAGPMFLTS